MTTTVLADLEALGAAAVLIIEAWDDPLVERLGYDPRSAYAERFWLPVLGPSTMFLLRHLARGLEEAPGGFACELAATARALGLGDRQGRNSPFFRTVARAVDFDAARLCGDRLVIRRRLAPLPRRHVARLPETLQREHERFLRREAARAGAPVDELLRRRGRQLALSLLQLGEEPSAVFEHLTRWRFPADLAQSCLEWAGTQRELQGRRQGVPEMPSAMRPGNAPAPLAL